MDFTQILEAIKQIQPSLTAVSDTGAAIITMGGWVVSLVQTGKKANIYRISRQKKKGTKVRTPTDVALVVDVTWSISPQVIHYLEQQKIDAEILLMVNNQKTGTGKWLRNDKPKEWENTVHVFNTMIQKIFGDSELAGAHIHIFIAAPVALAYALGAAWGTVHHATVYHWDSGEKIYYPVIITSTKIKPGSKN